MPKLETEDKGSPVAGVRIEQGYMPSWLGLVAGGSPGAQSRLLRAVGRILRTIQEFGAHLVPYGLQCVHDVAELTLRSGRHGIQQEPFLHNTESRQSEGGAQAFMRVVGVF